MLVAYSLVALYPLISTVAADNYQDEYTLVFNATGANSTMPQPETLTCNKNETAIEPLSGTMKSALRLSIGDFCQPNSFSYPLDCGVQCLAQTPQNPAGMLCKSIAPRVSCDAADIMNQTERMEFKQHCCVMQPLEKYNKTTMQLLEEPAAKEVPAAHFYMWCVVGTLVYVIWLVSVQEAQAAQARAMHRNNITAADYSVFLSNVGGCKGNDERLEDFGRHYGVIVMAFHLRSLGYVLTKCNDVRSAACEGRCRLSWACAHITPLTKRPAQLCCGMFLVVRCLFV